MHVDISSIWQEISPAFLSDHTIVPDFFLQSANGKAPLCMVVQVIVKNLLLSFYNGFVLHPSCNLFPYILYKGVPGVQKYHPKTQD